MADVKTLPKGGKIVWHGGAYANDLRRAYAKRCRQACEKIRDGCRKNLSATGGQSSPGGFPRSDTGRLRDSIFVTFDEKTMTGSVGTPLKYGLYLEFGTQGGQIVKASDGSVLSWKDPRTGEGRFAKWVKLSPIAPRPFLKPTIDALSPVLRQIFTAKLPDSELRNVA